VSGCSTPSLSTSHVSTRKSNSDDSDFSESEIPVKQEVLVRRSFRPNKSKRAETPYYMVSQSGLRYKANIADPITHNHPFLPKTVKKALTSPEAPYWRAAMDVEM
jgi:hypothetical protein